MSFALLESKIADSGADLVTKILVHTDRKRTDRCPRPLGTAPLQHTGEGFHGMSV